MDREEECVCCHEIEQVGKKNQEVMEYTKQTLSYDCITDNPGLDGWVLQSAWLDFNQQYGSTAYEGPEHKISRHCAYRQLVRWCWGIVGKEIRVVSDLFDFMTTDVFLFSIHYLAMFGGSHKHLVIIIYFTRNDTIDEHENIVRQYKL